MPRYTGAMATILASWELGLRYGHLASLAPAARALAVLGHRTVLASKDVEIVGTMPDRPFATVLQAPVYPHRRPLSSTLTYAAVVADGGLYDAPAVELLVREWLAIIDREKPDALLAEYAPVSLLAAHVAGLPAARFGIGFTTPPPLRPFPSLLPWTNASEADRAASDAPADAVVQAICRRLGAPILDGLAELLAQVPAALMTWPELDIYGARRDVRYYGTLEGFGGVERPAWPEGAGPKVFVYLSIGHRLADRLAEALSILGWPTVWHSAKPPRELPATILFSHEPLDMSYAVGQAAIQIGRGGHASVCDGLRAGKPQLMLPDTLETLLLAGRLARQNLALFASEDKDAEGIAAMLRHLASDPTIRAAAEAFRDRYSRYDPRAAAAELARDLTAAWGF